jgi:peptidoglycan/LPS O-acetylase OafA/YrhL
VPIADAVARYGLSLAFLNETRFGSFFPGSDSPYWSLGYEAAYYALFGFAFYAQGRLRLLGCGAIILLARTQVLLLLPLWLVGLLTYWICRRNPLSRLWGGALFLASLAALVAYISWASVYGFLGQFHALYQHELGQIAQDLVLALLFAANIVGLDAISCTIPDRLLRLTSVARWLAGSSFSLYIFHMPVLTFIKAAGTWPESSWANRGALLFGTLGTVFTVAEIGERRKDFWRGLIGLGAQPCPDGIPKRP